MPLGENHILTKILNKQTHVFSLFMIFIHHCTIPKRIMLWTLLELFLLYIDSYLWFLLQYFVWHFPPLFLLLLLSSSLGSEVSASSMGPPKFIKTKQHPIFPIEILWFLYSVKDLALQRVHACFFCRCWHHRNIATTFWLVETIFVRQLPQLHADDLVEDFFARVYIFIKKIKE